MVLKLLLLIADLIEHVSQNFHHLFMPGHFFLLSVMSACYLNVVFKIFCIRCKSIFYHEITV